MFVCKLMDRHMYNLSSLSWLPDTQLENCIMPVLYGLSFCTDRPLLALGPYFDIPSVPSRKLRFSCCINSAYLAVSAVMNVRACRGIGNRMSAIHGKWLKTSFSICNQQILLTILPCCLTSSLASITLTPSGSSRRSYK